MAAEVVYIDCSPDDDRTELTDVIDLCTSTSSAGGATEAGEDGATSRPQALRSATLRCEEPRSPASLPPAGQLTASLPATTAVSSIPTGQPQPAGPKAMAEPSPLSSPGRSCQTGAPAASVQLPTDLELSDAQQGEEEMQQAQLQEETAAAARLPLVVSSAGPVQVGAACMEQQEIQRRLAGDAAQGATHGAPPPQEEGFPPGSQQPGVVPEGETVPLLLGSSRPAAVAAGEPMAADEQARCASASSSGGGAAVPVAAAGAEEWARLLSAWTAPGNEGGWPWDAVSGAVAVERLQSGAGGEEAAAAEAGAGRPQRESSAAGALALAAAAAAAVEEAAVEVPPRSPHALVASVRADMAALQHTAAEAAGDGSGGVEAEGPGSAAVETALGGIVEGVALAAEGDGGDREASARSCPLALAGGPSLLSTPAAAQTAAAGLQAATAQQQQQQKDLPAPESPASMLARLRSLISPTLLQRYGSLQVVDAAEKSDLDERMAIYHKELERLRHSKEHTNKDDMKAVKNLRTELNPEWPVWARLYDIGHPPGVEVGRKFTNRSEMQVAGVHSEPIKGISLRGKAGECAVAICCSGGYQDDNDHGSWLLYTGEGGRDDQSRQVRDQSWESKGNRALREAYQQGQPVRVARGSKDGGKLSYSYDGLYAIVEAKRVPNKDGILVCRFTMVGISGHFNTAARRVSFLEMRGFKSVQLATKESRKKARAAAPEHATGVKRGADRKPMGTQQRKGAAAAPPRPKPQAKALQERAGLMLADISGGVERVPIPVFNEVDSEPPPSAANGFTYIRESQVISDPVAKALVGRALAAMPGDGHWCGLEQQRRLSRLGQEAFECNYNKEACLMWTLSHGIWECCTGCKGPDCQLNKVVTSGIQLPLEVFRALNKGWGLRCSAKIYAGDFVCSYEGEIVTNSVGDARKGADAYLYDMDHFTGQYSDPGLTVWEHLQLPPLPPGLDLEENEHLVIDALHYGNVARFINHSCNPNCLVQTVFTEGSSTLAYRTSIFAARVIRPYEELTYDYKYKPGSVPGVVLQCHCGAKNCRRRML